MKRHKSTVLPGLLVLFLMGAAAHAQPAPPGQSQQQEALRLIEVLHGFQQDGGARNAVPGQRRGGGGGRGAAPVTDLPLIGNVPAGGVRFRLGNQVSGGGAWWTNAALVARLGITDDQKTKIERAFENHREKIMSTTSLLEKEEAQLAGLLGSEPIDRNAIFTQVDHVVQARAEMERANSAMTLEMREVLTRAQWMQLTQLNEGAYLTTVQDGLRALHIVTPGERGASPPAPEPAPGPGGRRGAGQRQQ